MWLNTRQSHMGTKEQSVHETPSRQIINDA